MRSAPWCGGSDPGLSHVHRTFPHQFFQLGWSQFPPRSLREVAQEETSEPDPLEHGDLLPDGREHHTDLPLPALVDGDAVRVRRLAEEDPDSRGPGHLFLDLDSLLQLCNIRIGETAGGCDPVLLLMLEAGMRQFVSQLTVVRQHKQPGAVFIQPSSRMQSGRAHALREKLQNRRPVPVILRGAEVSLRLVHYQVHPVGGDLRHLIAGHHDCVDLRVDLLGVRRRDASVYLHQPRVDELRDLAAGPVARVGKHSDQGNRRHLGILPVCLTALLQASRIARLSLA
jgi:hypothetical protein